jgi:hypothetical protein
MTNHNSLLKALWTHPGFRIAAVVLAVVVSQPQNGSAEPPPNGGHGHPSNISVRTYFDANQSGSAIESDNDTAYEDGVEGVTSILTTNGYNGIVWGDWQFDTYGSTDRSVGHSFDTAGVVAIPCPWWSDPPTMDCPGGDPNPPFTGTRYLKSHVAVACTLINRDMLTMGAGDSFPCPLHNRFYVPAPTLNDLPNNQDYNLAPSISFTGHPETTDVQVTCNDADSGGCKDWSIDPIDSTGAVARLVAPWVGKGKSQPPLNLGDYKMFFHIHVTRP